MFGESDSESPRVPSPWDSLSSSPLPSPPNQAQFIPKLVPEAEEGNVEYKLQLLSPTPGRFARLVTQLKWRLLEGGGQAYYELGVADSGTLVGLPRQQLEESLETLEMMAGEIGASVIVVKEIEVPQELSLLAESQLEKWDASRKITRRKDLLRMMKLDMSSPSEFETELSHTDAPDSEECTCYHSPVTSVTSLEEDINSPPTSSPSTFFPFDSELAMFPMDLGEDVANYADSESPDGDNTIDCAADVFVGLEISAVYKPRPMKKRATHTASHSASPFVYTRKKLKNGYPPSQSTTGETPQDPGIHSLPNGTKAQFRRDRRDKQRQMVKLSTSPTHTTTHRFDESPSELALRHLPSSSFTAVSSTFVSDSPVTVVEPPTGDTSATAPTASEEPRLIVEALVVRKLSLDEAFLDFEGFSLH